MDVFLQIYCINIIYDIFFLPLDLWKDLLQDPSLVCWEYFCSVNTDLKEGLNGTAHQKPLKFLLSGKCWDQPTWMDSALKKKPRFKLPSVISDLSSGKTCHQDVCDRERSKRNHCTGMGKETAK